MKKLIRAALNSSLPVCQFYSVLISGAQRTHLDSVKRSSTWYKGFWKALMGSVQTLNSLPLCLLRCLVFGIVFILSWLWSACLSVLIPRALMQGGWCFTQLKPARFLPEQHLLANSFPQQLVSACIYMCVWVLLDNAVSAPQYMALACAVGLM